MNDQQVARVVDVVAERFSAWVAEGDFDAAEAWLAIAFAVALDEASR